MAEYLNKQKMLNMREGFVPFKSLEIYFTPKLI